MAIESRVTVRCPRCGKEQETGLVQSVNARTDATHKARLLAGELNVLTCECGARTPLAANLFFHDPDEDYYCHVCPDDASLTRAKEAFAAAGAKGTQRLVPSMNALVEKVKLLEAGLDDWAVEVVKLLLLASLDETNLNRVLLFDRREEDAIHWLIVLDDGATRAMTSPLAQYDRIAAQDELRPRGDELEIDRLWATHAAQMLVRS